MRGSLLLAACSLSFTLTLAGPLSFAASLFAFDLHQRSPLDDCESSSSQPAPAPPIFTPLQPVPADSAQPCVITMAPRLRQAKAEACTDYRTFVTETSWYPCDAGCRLTVVNPRPRIHCSTRRTLATGTRTITSCVPYFTNPVDPAPSQEPAESPPMFASPTVVPPPVPVESPPMFASPTVVPPPVPVESPPMFATPTIVPPPVPTSDVAMADSY